MMEDLQNLRDDARDRRRQDAEGEARRAQETMRLEEQLARMGREELESSLATERYAARLAAMSPEEQAAELARLRTEQDT